MTFRLSPAAEEDIQSIYLAGLDKFGGRQAEDYVERIRAVLHVISSNPRLARERTDVGLGLRVHPFRSHVIIYRIDGDGILVLRVRHGREDWQNEDETD